MIKRLVLAILPLTMSLSCDKVMPGGIWEKFEQDLLIEKQIDQGPWGGTRTYYWKSNSEGYFTKKKVIVFTSSNDWELVDSIKYQDEQFKNWNNNGKRSFIIEVGPFDPSTEDNLLKEVPRWTNSDLTLYKFETGWIILYPGTDSSTEVNGFITLSEDGREMTVYHLWGE